MIMKFEVDYVDDDFSEENKSEDSDSEYISPQRLRGGCDNDYNDEGDDMQVDDDFVYDEESALSAHGFHPYEGHV